MHKKQNKQIHANNGKNVKKMHDDEYNADLDSPNKQYLTPEIKEQQQYIQYMSNYLNATMKKLQQKRKQKITQAHNFINSLTKLSNDYLQQRYVYLISYNWLQSWKKYIKYEQIKNKQIIQWNQQFDENVLGQMNKDLINQKFVISIKNEGQNNYLNVVLKDGLKQGIDFIYANQQIWSIFKYYKHIQIKRQVNQRIKKVQCYPLKINLIFLSNRILKELKQKTRQQLSIQRLQVSRYISLGQFQAMLGQKLSQILALRHHNCLDQINYNNAKKRFILINDTNFDEAKFSKRLAMTLLYQNYVDSYSIYLPIKVLNFDMEFKYQVKADQATIICQFIEENENPNNRICYSSNYIPFAQCPKCKQKKKLQFCCECKYVAYCSQPCINTDVDHRKKCIKKRKQTKKVLSVPMQKRNELVGLVNLGNTCYMNSGIQCISNIYELAEYYITDKYIKDINAPNWLGTHGNLSNSFANLLKNLWCQYINQFYPCQFKETIDCYHSIFSNGGQHDSGQFVSYLLDGLHEDLNKGNNNQVQIQQKQIQIGKPENVIAGEQWKNHLLKHNSKIVELMHGQYRSQIECLTCSHKALQFDPFTICHLPIPDLKKKLCIIFQDDLHLFQQKFIYYYSPDDIISDAINKIRLKNSIPNDTKILAYYHNSELRMNQKIQSIVKYLKGQIYARIMLKQQKQTGCKIIVNYKQIKNQNTMNQEYALINSKLYKFSPQLTYKQLHHILYHYNKDLLNIKDYQNQNFQSKSRKIMIHIQKLEYIGVCVICKQNCKGCELPYNKQKIGPIFLNNTVALRYLIKDKLQKQYKKVTNQLDSDLNLYDCLEKFEQPQILTKDNAWYCPKCQQNVQARKQMMIYKTPKILIINLKRFNQGQKNQNLINFPIAELDLTHKVINSYIQQLQNLPDQQQIKIKQKQKIIYDLFAVSNHYGTIQKGHYTSFCKNIGKKAWYQFDDNIVKPLDQQKIVQNGAYILFYRRR